MRAGSAITGSARHVSGVVVQAILIAAIVASLLFAASILVGRAPGGAGSVFAGKGGHANAATTSSIRLDQSAASLELGSRVTFTTAVVGLTGNEYAMVYLKCMQGGDVVYGQLDSPDTTFVLGGGSSPWWGVGGPADCVGYLKAYSTRGGPDTVRVLSRTAEFTAN
jgi:hypothetical protein